MTSHKRILKNAPPADKSLLTSEFTRKLKVLAQDKEELAQMKENAERSIGFSGEALETSRKRKKTQAEQATQVDGLASTGEHTAGTSGTDSALVDAQAAQSAANVDNVDEEDDRAFDVDRDQNATHQRRNSTSAGALHSTQPPDVVDLASVATSKLKCLLCGLDPTSEFVGKLWIRENLDQHLRSDYHTRTQQILRAVKNGGTGQVDCPLCHEQLASGIVLEHLAATHPEQLW